MSRSPHLHRRSLRCASAAGLLLVALGCVDPRARYDSFVERSAGMRGHDAGMVAPSDRIDFSGHYLAALSTTLAPGQPILFSCDVTVAEDLATLELSFQPLTTDTDDAPRTPTGESFGASDVPYAEDGSFDAALGEVTVPGRANPISGSDIVATVAIVASAHAMSAELPMYFCGQAGGMVSVPLALDLAGSTIAAVEASSFGDVEPLARCPVE